MPLPGWYAKSPNIHKTPCRSTVPLPLQLIGKICSPLLAPGALLRVSAAAVAAAAGAAGAAARAAGGGHAAPAAASAAADVSPLSSKQHSKATPLKLE